MDDKIKNAGDIIMLSKKIPVKYNDKPLYQQEKERTKEIETFSQDNNERLGHFEIRQLFDDLRQRYLRKWNEQFKNDVEEMQVMNLWAAELAQIKKENLKKAVAIVIDQHAVWPPTLGEFKKLCLSFSKYKESAEVLQFKPNFKAPKNGLESQIDLGAIVCKRLKSIYPEKDWFQISEVFTKLKKKLRSTMNMDTEIEFLGYLSKYSTDDLKEALQ